MNMQKRLIWSRREFLRGLTLAGGAGLLGLQSKTATAEPLPETSTVRLSFTRAACIAAMDVAAPFLRMEGFTDVQYVKAAGGFSATEMTANGDVDFNASFAGSVIYHLAAGFPIIALGGLHVGCYELFAHEPIRTVKDFKGRRVGIQTLSASAHLYVSIMAKQVGLNPKKDIEWVVPSSGTALERFVAGDTDVFLGFPLNRRSCAHAVSIA